MTPLPSTYIDLPSLLPQHLHFIKKGGPEKENGPPQRFDLNIKIDGVSQTLLLILRISWRDIRAFYDL